MSGELNAVWSKAKPKRSKLRITLSRIADIVYYLGVILFVVILAVQGVQCIIRYFQFPSYTSTKIVDQSEADFPAVTVCPDGSNNNYNLDALRKNGFDSGRSYYQILTEYGFVGNDSQKNPRDTFLEVTWDLWEMLEYLRFHLEQPTPEGETVVTISKENYQRDNFHERRKRTFGRCYTILPEMAIRKLGVFKMEIKYRSQMKQYIHRFNQYLNSNGRMGHKIYPNEIVQNQINYVDVTMIPRVDEDNNPTCSSKSFDHCMNEVLEYHMLKEAGCMAPWVMNDSNICTDLDKALIAYDVAYRRVTNQFNDCLQPCNFFLVNVGAKNFQVDESLNGSSLQVYYFSRQVMVNTEYYLYPFLSLAAEIGGYVGLLLGISFLQGTRLFVEWMKAKAREQHLADRMTPTTEIDQLHGMKF